MPFTSYKEIGRVLQEYQILFEEKQWVSQLEISISQKFKSELEYNLQAFSFEDSEYAVCENLIYPILREIYKSYDTQLALWSHKPIFYNEKLCGTPNYIIAKKSALGKPVFEKPFTIAIETKKDNLVEGWGQGLAETIALQKLNDSSKIKTIFGIVSNGQFWQFGKLDEN